MLNWPSGRNRPPGRCLGVADEMRKAHVLRALQRSDDNDGYGRHHGDAVGWPAHTYRNAARRHHRDRRQLAAALITACPGPAQHH